ncbi:MAG: Gfo/Idh/MocA family protein, partial [Methylococcales bacterium]
CDTAKYVLDVLEKYIGIRAYGDFEELLQTESLDAIIIATPSRFHGSMVKTVLERNIHVFCEKPFCIDAEEGKGLAELAEQKGLVNQVGYHHRFDAAFQEVKHLLDAGTIGGVTRALAEAYGPVVLQPKGSTWRTRRSEGGGCLYDYAAHPINLVNWYFGSPDSVSGTVLNHIFSQETEDEVYGTLHYRDGKSAQISVNWSDESYRRMTTKINIWGTGGRIYADRQECQVFIRDSGRVPPGYEKGWNVRYTTELTPEVWFYVRGEEYSAQLDYFVRCICEGKTDNVNSFASAVETDRVMAMMITDSEHGSRVVEARPVIRSKSRWWMEWRRLFGNA